MRNLRPIAGVLCALILSGCPAPTQPPAAPTPDGEPSIVPVAGGTLVLTVAGELPPFDPHLAVTPAAWATARALHRGLYAYPDAAGRQGAEPLPDIADGSPEVEEGGVMALIPLKKGVRFSDGAEMAAVDVVASLTRLMKSDRGIGPELKRVLGDVVADEGGAGVRMTARGSVDQVVDLLAHPQAAILPRGTGALGKARNPIGAGPYRISAQTPTVTTLTRRPSLNVDPLRPAYADRIEVRAGGAPSPTSIELDPGPPDLLDPDAVEAPGATVASMCVRFLDIERAGLNAAQRAQVITATRRLAEIGTGPRASSAIPPILQDGPPPTIAETKPTATPAFDLIASSSPRDTKETAALKRVLPRIRVKIVPVGSLYGGGPIPAGARIRTWCADWPDARAIELSPASAETSISLWWPTEHVVIGERVRGWVGSAMFPRGDPTALWVGA